MKQDSHLLPIQYLRVYVESGKTHLHWHMNSRYFKESNSDPAEESGSFRIYRKAIGALDESYAHCCRPFGVDNAVCVYEGPVDQVDGAYIWTDTPPPPVSAVQNYVYFVASRTMSPLELLPVTVRHPEMWWTYDELRKRLSEIAAEHPEAVTLGTCGKTVADRDIPVMTAGTGTPALGIAGLVHAGESGPELMVPVVARLLREEPELMQRVRVIIVPSVNIDNREAMLRGYPYYLRANKAGVDLNRNFPAWWEDVSTGYGQRTDQPESATYRGIAPACAPETRAVMQVFSDKDLKVVFSCHWLNSLCAFPALSCALCPDDKAYIAECRKVIELYSAGLYPERAYEEWFHGMQTTNGSLPSWLYRARHIPAFDMEGGSIQLGYGTNDHSPFDMPMMADYRERHFRAIRNVLHQYVL